MPVEPQPMSRCVPVDDALLVRRVEEVNQSAGGIYMPDNMRLRDERAVAEIIAVGPGKLCWTPPAGWTRRPLDYQSGERIYYRLHAGTCVTHDGEDCYIIVEEEVLCRIVPAKTGPKS